MRQLDAQLKLMGMQGVVGMAIGALDQALWDALGRAANLPVAVLLGGEVKPLDAYDSYGLVDIKTDLPLLEASAKTALRRSRSSWAPARWPIRSPPSPLYGS
jgi:mandelate racemase